VVVVGTYANYNDVHFPTQAWELAEECTACKNTGWVAYPVNVGVDQNEYDPCPHGCYPMDDNTRLDYYVRVESVPVQEDMLGAWIASLRSSNYKDPLIVLAKDPKRRSLVGAFAPPPALRVPGRITTDVPVVGWTVDSGYRCEVPAYLVGTPVELDDYGFLTVRYEYLGSYIDIEFLSTHFRFAYWWETGFSTGELLR
jgi:hypothetical protein